MYEGWEQWWDPVVAAKGWKGYEEDEKWSKDWNWYKPGTRETVGDIKATQGFQNSWLVKDYWGESVDTDEFYSNADAREDMSAEMWNKQNFDHGKQYLGGHNVNKDWVKSQVGLGQGKLASNFAWTPQEIQFARWHEGYWNPDYEYTGESWNIHDPTSAAATALSGDDNYRLTEDSQGFYDAGLRYSISDEGVINPFDWQQKDVPGADDSTWSNVGRGGGAPGLYHMDDQQSLFDTDTWASFTTEQKSALQQLWQRGDGNDTMWHDFSDFAGEYPEYETGGEKELWDSLTDVQRRDWGLDLQRVIDDKYWLSQDFGLLSEQDTMSLYKDINKAAVDFDWYNQNSELVEAAKRLNPEFTGFTDATSIRLAQREMAMPTQYVPESLIDNDGTDTDSDTDTGTGNVEEPFIPATDGVTGGLPEDWQAQVESLFGQGQSDMQEQWSKIFDEGLESIDDIYTTKFDSWEDTFNAGQKALTDQLTGFTGDLSNLDSTLSGKLNDVNSKLDDVTKWNDQIDDFVTEYQEGQIDQQERARAKASYGSMMGQPLNPRVRGVKTINLLDNYKGMVGDFGGARGSFNRKGNKLKIGSINV